jgi:hypothetical protein
MAQMAVHRTEMKLENVPLHIQEEIKTFIAGLPHIKYLEQDGNPSPQWTVLYAGTRDEALEVLFGEEKRTTGIKGAGSYLAARTAASTYGRAKAFDEVTFAASQMVHDSVHGYAELDKDALAMDARLFAAILLVKDLNFDRKEEHMRHAQEVIEVWKKGYALLDDVKGKLFVYAQEDAPTDFIGFIKSQVRVVKPDN